MGYDEDLDYFIEEHEKEECNHEVEIIDVGDFDGHIYKIWKCKYCERMEI